MPVPFSSTLRSLEADRLKWGVVSLAVGTFVLSLWAIWLLGAEVTLYETSETSRLETRNMVYPIVADVSGKIVNHHLILGQQIREGEILLELDSELQKGALEGKKGELLALEQQLVVIRDQLKALEKAYAAAERSGGFAVGEVRAQMESTKPKANFAREQANKFSKLDKIVSDLERMKAATEAQSLEQSLGKQELTVRRLESDVQKDLRDRWAKIQELRGDEANLEREKSKIEALIAQLSYEIQRRLVRAPLLGEIDSASPLQIGTYVKAGETLGSIVPAAALRVVAQFKPASALGRIKPGQTARLRLDGFPWLQWGVIEARVIEVGREVKDGLVRVHLEITGRTSSRIPLEHGLPGTAEIAVERISPMNMILRAAGRLFS